MTATEARSGATEGIDEEIARVIATAEPPPGIDQPEAADKKGGFWKPEIVGAGVAHHVMAASELLPNHPDCAHVARIVRLDQAMQVKIQHPDGLEAAVDAVLASPVQAQVSRIERAFSRQRLREK